MVDGVDPDAAAIAGSTTCSLPGVSFFVSFIGAYVRNSSCIGPLFFGEGVPRTNRPRIKWVTLF